MHSHPTFPFHGTAAADVYAVALRPLTHLLTLYPPEHPDSCAAQAMITDKRVCNVEPEHGPWPYQQSMPSTKMEPTHDIWLSNKHVIQVVKDRWPAILASM